MSEKKRSVWQPIVPVPEGTPEPRFRHSERGEPLHISSYYDALDGEDRLLGHVCRFLTSTGEPIHLPLTWCQDQEGMKAWRWVQFERMRPLYGLDELRNARPEEDVTIVFDEFAADYVRELMPGFLVVSWPGGIRKIDEVDWSPLRGRRVWIWPTKTLDRERQRRDMAEGAGRVVPRDRQSGWKAALKIEKIITGFGGSVIMIFDPWKDESLPDGWNVGMAGQQEWTQDRLTDWMSNNFAFGLGSDISQRIRKLKGEPPPSANSDAELVSTPSGADAGELEKDGWIPDLVYRNGDLSACLFNVHQIITHRDDWKGVIALDEFSLKIVKRKAPPYEHGALGEWTEADDARTAMLLQRQYGFTPSSALVREAISVIADGNRVHSVRDYLAKLKWDRTQRLEHWITDFLGVSDSPYVRLVAKWWLMGAIARVLRPGCKFDYVLVLAGKQGKKKSSVLAALGGEWFTDADLDFSNKDSMIALQGKFICELPELGALARSDERRQKSFLSRRFDEYRPPYGRGFVKVPRQMVFAGSTNEWEWNKDPTGGRRFWPVECGTINIEGVVENRDQLFAEALHCVQAGEVYWPTEEQQSELFDPEQLKVEQQDAFVEALAEYVENRPDGRAGWFSLLEAANNGLKIQDVTKITRDIQSRIGSALRKLGCTKKEPKGKVRFMYAPPQSKPSEEGARPVLGQHAQQEGDSNGYF